MSLDPQSLQDLVTFLLPYMSTEQERASLYALAFGSDHPLLYQLRTNSQETLPILIQRLTTFGELRPGVPALWALLEVVRQQVGLDKQSQIDRFRALLGLPPLALPDRVFVSYSRKNERFARRIEADLQDAGLRAWIDRTKIRVGEEWRQSIQRGIQWADFIVFCLSPDSATSEICHWELSVAQQQGKLILPIMLYNTLPLLHEPSLQPIAWLQERHILDFTQPELYGQRFKELLAALPGYNPPDNYYEDTLDTRQIPNPFRGLEAFREVDYNYYAGREDAVAELGQRLYDASKPRLLAVVGASGSGKSSLVRAGLLSLLRERPEWEFAVFKPGKEPLLALAQRLEHRIDVPASELRERFRQRPAALHEEIQNTLSGPQGEARFLLVVDQCEEIFAPAAEAERQAFLDALLAAVTAPHSPVYVLLTLRADFFSHLSAYPDLAKLVEDNLFIATAMTPEQLRHCIEDPARKVGLRYEAGLVEPILEAVREQPGVLPLLQYALKELYERRQGRMLTRQAYQAIGGVQGAIASRAETIYKQLNSAQKRVMQRLLLQLVEVGEEAVTRRRVRLSLLQLRDVTAEDLRAVAEILTAEQARLLVAGAPLNDDDPTNDNEVDLEVSHEALLTHWARLADWIAENKNDLRRGSEYLQLAQTWQAAGRREVSYLLMGARLATAQDWLMRADATQLQRDFIEASTAHQAEEIARLERLTRQVRIAIIGLVVVGILALLAGGFGIIQTNNAQESERRAATQANNALTAVPPTLTHVNQQVIMAQQQAASANTQVAQANVALAAVPPTLTQVAQVVLKAESLIESLRLASFAQRILTEANANPELVVLLGIHALRAGYSPQADQVLIQATDKLFIKNRFKADNISEISSVVFAPDGKAVLSGTQSGDLILWEIASGRPLRTFAGHTSGVTSVAFAPDGTTALSASLDNTLILWDIASGRPLRTFAGHTSGVTSVVFSPDGKTALSGSQDNTLILWDVETGQPLRRFSGHTGAVASVAFAPDGKTALSGSSDKILILWDVSAGQQLRTFSGHAEAVTSVVFAPDGKTALSGSSDQTLILWNVSIGGLIRVFSGHIGAITSVTFAFDGKTAVSSSSDRSLILWDMDNSLSHSILSGHTFWVTSVAFSPDGKTVLSGSQDDTITLWDVASGRQVRTFTGHTGDVSGVVFSPDGRTVLSGSLDNTVILWDMASGQPLRIFDHTSGVASVAFSPDGKTVLSGSEDNTLILWDVASGQLLHAFSGHLGAVTSVAFSPDGKSVLSGSKDNSVALWDIASGQRLHTFTGHVSDATSVAFSPDGETILSGSLDYTLILWDIASGQRLRTFTGHTSGVTSVAFSPDGKMVLSGSQDETLVLWDIASGQSVRTFYGHTGVVTSVAFSPNGKAVLGGSHDNTLRIWDAGYEDFLIYACQRVFRELSLDERDLYGIPDQRPTCPQFATKDNPILTPFPVTSTPMATRTPFSEMWTPINPPTPTDTLTPTITLTPSATPVAAGAARVGEQRGEILPEGSQSWSYAGQQGEMVIITIRADQPAGITTSAEERIDQGLLDAFLIVYRPDNLRLENDDDWGVPQEDVTRTNSRLNLVLPVDGIYEIEVRGFANESSGTYRLVIEPWDIEALSSATAQAALTPSRTPTPTSDS